MRNPLFLERLPEDFLARTTCALCLERLTSTARSSACPRLLKTFADSFLRNWDSTLQCGHPLSALASKATSLRVAGTVLFFRLAFVHRETAVRTLLFFSDLAGDLEGLLKAPSMP